MRKSPSYSVYWELFIWRVDIVAEKPDNYVVFKLLDKKVLFGGIVVALLSFEVCCGIIAGYLITKLGAGRKAGEQGRIKSLIFRFGKRHFHFHHWLCGLSVLALIITLRISLPFPEISMGFLGGMVVQGISYPDWYEIIKTVK